MEKMSPANQTETHMESLSKILALQAQSTHSHTKHSSKLDKSKVCNNLCTTPVCARSSCGCSSSPGSVSATKLTVGLRWVTISLAVRLQASEAIIMSSICLSLYSQVLDRASPSVPLSGWHNFLTLISRFGWCSRCFGGTLVFFHQGTSDGGFFHQSSVRNQISFHSSRVISHKP